MLMKNNKETETISPVQQKRTSRTAAPSIISADTLAKGTFSSTGDVQVDGRIEGEIIANAIVVGELAFVIGDISAEEAVIRGRVEGSIRARKIQLCATSHVEAKLLHQTLLVEAGAFFEGNCRHSENPLSDAAPAVVKPVAVASLTPSQNGAAPSLLGDEQRPAPAAARASASFTPLKS